LQAINYSWHKGTSWAVLTDFQRLIIYNAEVKEKNLADARFIELRFDQFVEQFEKLWWLSKPGFQEGLLDKEAVGWGKKLRKTKVGDQLLSELMYYRELLSKNILKNNAGKNLSQEDIDESVQKIIDRLIFIRTAEDRDIEPSILISKVREYEEKTRGKFTTALNEVYVRFDLSYNSKLFTFDLEDIKKRHLCENLEIDNEVLFQVIRGLYQSKDGLTNYDFSAIDADVLGNIYEQYLSHILKKTDKRAKVESKEAHRKEQGIYYTPTYIVDYIVRNTLGEVLKDKKPEEVDKLKVLDMACGSGSFLLKAFDILNEYYKRKDKNYQQTNLEAGASNITRKTKILKNNIYGVDLDPKAVEIAQLNLLLKAAETKHRLPDLRDNVKCGNSLIDQSLSEDTKAFDWPTQFSGIFDNGGFDVIIGNPPYINIKLLTKTQEGEKVFYRNRYETASGNYDIYVLFIEKAIKLLKPGGRLGYIVPNKFTVTDYGYSLRRFILQHCVIEKIVDVSNLPVFKGVGTYPVIIILRKENENTKRLNNKIKILNAKAEEELISVVPTGLKQETYEMNDKNIFSLQISNKITGKIKSIGKALGGIATINCGTTGFEYQNWGKLITSEKTSGSLPFIITGNIAKYALDRDKMVRYQGKKFSNAHFKRGTQVTPGKWALFSSKKIVIRGMALGLTAAYDEVGCACGVSVYTVTEPKDDLELLYLLGLLNSKLLDYFYKSQFISKHLAGKYIGYNKGQIEQIPIKIVSEKEQEIVIRMVEKRLSLAKNFVKLGDKQTDERTRLEKEIAETDRKIDELVYELYGLTEEERKIVEEAVK
ncbi:MAG: N-6 DNA methylase, partial [Candidatus Micrarchaeota archaeon]|nr:N-6 DNA methylase [Candidatus Micrarchaeota archaeon]